MLKGPAILAYVRAMTSSDRSVLTGGRLLPLASPLLLGIVLAAPFYLLDGAAKVAFMARGEGELASDQSLAARGVLALIIAALLVSLACLIAAYGLVVRHMRRVRDLFSNIEDKTLSWVRWVVLILSAAWIWGVAKSGNSVLGMAPVWQEVVASALEVLWVGALAFFGVLQQPVFGERPITAGAAPKYSRSALDADRMDRIAEKLRQAMQVDKLFADPSLSLRALSDRIGASENYISQTLNERLGRNFFDFVNAARIEEAKALLSRQESTVLEVAMAVGFNSRSTFNAAFRKHAGCPPSAFRDGQAIATPPATSDPARPDA
jgi:AraC-like DNA-binding protein